MFGLFKKPWRKRVASLSADALPDALAEIVAEAAREVDRVGAVRITAPLSLVATVSGGEHQVYLANLLPQLRDADPTERPVLVERFLSVLSTSAQTGALRDLVPVLKSVAWLAEVQAMTQRNSSPEMLEKNQIAALPFVADMVIVFAFDAPGSMSFATVSVLAELEVTANDALLNTAKQVLRERLPPVSVRKGSASALLTCGGTFESSLLLLDDVIGGMSFLVEGDLIALAPTRDVLMITGTDMEGGLEETVAVMNDLVRGNPQYPLSQVPLLRKDGRWIPLH